MNEWETIDSAPKDGRYVLITWNDGGHIAPSFSTDEWPPLHVIPARFINSEWETVLADCDHGVWDDPSHERSPVGAESPTHWMPLPEPPK